MSDTAIAQGLSALQATQYQTHGTKHEIGTCAARDPHHLLAIDGQIILQDPKAESKKDHIAEEAADVLICLMNFCDKANIDLAKAFENKLAKNEQKYPVDKARGSRAKYDEL